MRACDRNFTTVTTVYREMGMTFWLEQVEAEMRRLARRRYVRG